MHKHMHIIGFPDEQLSCIQQQYMEIHKHLQKQSSAADATLLMVMQQ